MTRKMKCFSSTLLCVLALSLAGCSSPPASNDAMPVEEAQTSVDANIRESDVTISDKEFSYEYQDRAFILPNRLVAQQENTFVETNEEGSLVCSVEFKHEEGQFNDELVKETLSTIYLGDNYSVQSGIQAFEFKGDTVYSSSAVLQENENGAVSMYKCDLVAVILDDASLLVVQAKNSVNEQEPFTALNAIASMTS